MLNNSLNSQLFLPLLQIKNSCLISTVMKATPYLEQVFHLIIRLLKQQGHDQIAEQIGEIYQLPQWIEKNNPLLKKGLTKIIKEYVKTNEKMLRYYQNRVENQQTQQVASRTRKKSVDSHRQSTSPKVEVKIRHHTKKAESPLVSKISSPKQAASPKQASNKTSSWMSKFQKPKTLEEINQVIDAPKKQIQEEVIVNHTKTNKKHKKVKIESSQYESQQDSFELEPKKKMKKQAKEEKKEEKKAQKKSKKYAKQQKQAEQILEQEVTPPKKQIKKYIKKELVVVQQKKQAVYPEYPTEYDGHPKKFFSRINPDDVGPIRDELKDNSFHAKAKFGQEADHWGQFGYDKLKDTRGDSFKKTKGKLKNRAFQGALMDINKINSIPIA